eukprot:gene6681-3346_t
MHGSTMIRGPKGSMQTAHASGAKLSIPCAGRVRASNRKQQQQLSEPVASRRSLIATAQRDSGVSRSAAVAESSTASPLGSAEQVIENCVVVGSGPAGYTAAIYAARANLKPVVFEGFKSGQGGQLMGTTEVENFPGFPEGVTGPELMERMRKQAERWGAELYTEDVEFIDLTTRPFTIRSTDREVRAHSMIIATGATARRLNLPNEELYWGKGISACAICDGASPLFKNGCVAVVGGGDSALEEASYTGTRASARALSVTVRALCSRTAVAVVGGGDSALEEAVYLTKYCNQVNLLVHVEDAVGGSVLRKGLKIVNKGTGEKRTLDVVGLFYGIGHQPNNKLISGQIDLDAAGYVKLGHGVSTNVEGVFAAGDLHDPEWRQIELDATGYVNVGRGVSTNVEGVFAAGDLHDPELRQAITAAGSGCMAALSVEKYLSSTGLATEFKTKEYVPDEVKEASEEEAAPPPPGEEAFDVNDDKHFGQFALLNGTPTLQLFKDQDLVKNLPGVKMKSEYRAMLSELLVK